MQNRVLIVGSLLLAALVALGPQVDAQTPHHTQERTRGCFTPGTTTGMHFLVAAGGSTEQILRAAPPAPPATRRTVTHSSPHAQKHVPPPAIPSAPSAQVRHSRRHTPAFGMPTTGCRLRLR